MGAVIHQRLNALLKKRRCTLLGVGPMSLNCVDAAIELADSHDAPLMLIASRRQIDSEQFGGGYVNNWTTGDFARYVIDRDKKGKVLLARDHGGPWQSPLEVDHKLSLRRAMESAKSSFRADLEAGFQVIHIDPSVDIHASPKVDDVLDRIYELYEDCWTHAQRLGQEVIFEIGTEEQSGSTSTQEELEYILNAVVTYCQSNQLPKPTFVVIQTGTKVMEMRNVGSFDSPIRISNELPAEIQVPKMIDVCNHYGILMKEHNTDYLSDEALEWHPRLGIHAANVAPEFGVAESKALVSLLENQGLQRLADRFLEISFNSKKWHKWMLKNSQATDRERALIAGHYVFSCPEFVDLKTQARQELVSKQIDLDEVLKQGVKQSIYRYMHNFRLTCPK
jgi:hypothetical protein